MKKKYYLRGLGTGIIITTLVLCVSFAYGKEDYILTDDEIISRASELGMAFEEETEEQTEDEETSEEETSIEETSIEETTTVEETSATVSSKEETIAETQSVAQTQAEEVFVTITIAGGMSTKQISQMLLDEGVIGNKDEFEAYVVENKLESDIATGTFPIKKGTSYEEILKIIADR